MKQAKIFDIAEYKDLSNKFYECLKFSNEELFKPGNHKNRIKQIGIIIQGLTGSGKTTLAKNIIQNLYDYYGKDNCGATYTNSLPLGIFLDKALEQHVRPVQILIYDDATSVRVKPKDQRTFFSLRHLMQDKTFLLEGVIYTIYITHDWYALDKTFRRNALFTIFISIPRLDKYSRNEYKRFIGQQALEELDRLSFQAIKKDSMKGKAVVVLPCGDNNIGYFYWKDLDVPYIELKEDLAS